MNRLAFTQASELNDGELVSRPFRVTCWPVVGKPLEVPVGHQAVLTGPKESVYVLKGGLQSLQGLPWGPYTVQFVDVRRRHLKLPSVTAFTQDSWQANVQTSLEYQVRSPHAVVQLDDPLNTLREAAVSAIIYVIKTTPHDLLIGTADHSGGSDEAFAALIQRPLRVALRGSGLEVVNVFVTQMQGDEQRLKIKRQSQIDETQLTVDQALLTRRISLERDQQALALLQAETKRKQAKEEQKIRLEQAKIEAEVTQSMQWVQQRHEQNIEAIKVYGQIFGKMAELSNLEVLGVSSRRRPREPGFNRFEAVLMQSLANLQALLAQEPLEFASGNGDILHDLISEIKELSTIEGLTWTLNPVKEGGLCLEARLDGIVLEITCRPGFPTVYPEVVVSGNGHDRAPFSLPWSEPRSLKEVVLEAIRHFSGAASAHDGASSALAA